MPAHGETRGWHVEHELEPLDTDPPIDRVALQRIVAWKYCAGCARWVCAAGVTGLIEWQRNHRDHA